MPAKNEQRWLCADCGNRITTFVRVIDSPVCSKHLKPVAMWKVYGETWGREK